MANKKAKVYTYKRVSTSIQVDGYSLDAQNDRMKKYAEFNDMISCRISGRKSSSRASFRRSGYTQNSRKMDRF